MSESKSDLDLETATPSALFDEGWRLQRELAKSGDESSSTFLVNRKRAIELLEKCEDMFDELSLFSTNEDIEELSANELR